MYVVFYGKSYLPMSVYVIYLHVTLSFEILNLLVQVSIISELWLLISIPSTVFTPRITNVQNSPIFHLGTGYLLACIFLKYFAKIRFSVSVYLGKISAYSMISV